MSLLVAAAFGLGLGILTGMPLGIVNVAVVDAAIVGRVRFAIGLGIGGAFADAIHAALAFIGVAHVLTSRPEIARGAAIAAMLLVAGYVVLAWKLRRRGRPPSDESRALRGVVTGLLLTLPNPGALGAWVAVAAVAWPSASTAEAVALALGVGIGSALWFVGLTKLARRVPPTHVAFRIVPRAALLVLVAIAVLGVVRAF